MQLFKWPVLCLIALGVADLLKESAALKMGDAGVCKTKIVSMTNKRITYTKFSTNRWCGKRRCIVRVHKSQPITQTQELATCCKGFEYQSESDVCVPRCTLGCHGGRCVAPDTCQCDPPLYLDPVHQNTCLTPTCDPPCVNAVCNANNTCICHPGYALNSTFSCTPQCAHPCVNGQCTAPNVCSCSTGYVKNEDQCVPLCSCVNGKCVAPDTCSCFEGFSPINGTHCEPVCEGCDGNCVAPNKCECFDGYASKEGICQPVCNSTCDNGYCSGPDQCTCFEGFVFEVTSGSCVKPEENCEGNNCPRGLGEGQCEVDVQKVENVIVKYRCREKRRGCTRQQKRFVTRKAIVCCAGWIFVDGVCEPEHPECNPPCVNARCTATGVCTCDTGLEPLNSTVCAPPCLPDQVNDFSKPELPCKNKCSQPCTNGDCVNIEECKCNPGFKPKDQYNCEHKCTGCEHGTCEAPEFECNCIEGYKKNEHGKCEPVCDDCEHGSCIAPNDCGNCHEGYRKVDNKCLPVCEEECQNSQCTAPNSCTCDSQYSKDATNKFKCNPLCEDACVNSTCVAPNTCMCLNGFEPAGNNWTCRPSCSSCANGLCIAPNTCDCFKGYEKVDTDICVPVCKSCDNGQCLAPENCVCNEGYEKNDTEECVPICESCDFGVCVAPNTCTCSSGYEKNDDNKCVPACKDCINGVCVKPNICVCNTGYKMDNITNTCRPDCNPSCVNSTCVAVDECDCLSGYQKTNSSNICRPACVSCSNGDCVEPGVCQCYDGFEILNGTCLPLPTKNCFDCGGACKDGICACLDGTLCHQSESADVESTPTLAGLQLTWMLGGALAILLVVIVTALMVRMWRQRQSYDKKTPDDNFEPYGSVACTIDNRLMHRQPEDAVYDDVELSRQTNLGLLDHTEHCVERL